MPVCCFRCPSSEALHPLTHAHIYLHMKDAHKASHGLHACLCHPGCSTLPHEHASGPAGHQPWLAAPCMCYCATIMFQLERDGTIR